MTRAVMHVLVLALVLCSGCAVTDKAAGTAQVAAAGNDRYLMLAGQALDGSVDPEMGLLPISPDQLAATPKPVRLLVERLLDAVNTNRHAFYSISFQLNKGPDPDTLGLTPVELPGENDDLLEDNQ